MKELVERFVRYVAVSSQSDAGTAAVPSSEGQRVLAQMLASEMQEMGLSEVNVDEHGIATGLLPGNGGKTSIGFVAHVDTVDVGLSADIHPQVLTFTGEDLCLNAEQDIWLRVSEHPELSAYIGQDIICTDGTSVLGADNKAAVAVVMTMLDHVRQSTAARGDIYVAFVPDEEIGLRGSKLLDLGRFRADFAYTIDSCALGEVVYETFNAGSARIDIEGVTAHPMSAKGVLVNPLLVAMDIINMFDRGQTPEYTEAKEGYFWFTGIEANASRATLRMNIRDFDRQNYAERQRFIHSALDFARARHPRASIHCEIEEMYSNIKDSLGDDRRSIDLLYKALEKLNIEPHTIAMRGGTDGSALSARGLVTPNFFTGAHNFHSWAEFLPVPSFSQSLGVALTLVELAAS